VRRRDNGARRRVNPGGGHIPRAVNVPWSLPVDPETRRSPKELRDSTRRGATPNKEVITYCRIGEGTSHTWFVLKYILKYPAVRVYDGSWAEWGNLVGTPVKRGNEP
jgi:thiosulfate/3-mercaptopyruvate sulfurtransferase